MGGGGLGHLSLILLFDQTFVKPIQNVIAKVKIIVFIRYDLANLSASKNLKKTEKLFLQ